MAESAANTNSKCVDCGKQFEYASYFTHLLEELNAKQRTIIELLGNIAEQAELTNLCLAQIDPSSELAEATTATTATTEPEPEPVVAVATVEKKKESVSDVVSSILSSIGG